MSIGEAPQIGTLSSINEDGSRKAIHPADVRGRFIRWRRWTFAALIAFYVALPLVKVNGHPAVHLDIAARRFYLFGSTFNAQDFWIVVFLLTTVGFSLLFVTAWKGRAWCGWACPQTVFLEGVFRPIERLIEGPREKRLRRAKDPWGAGRVARAVLRHGAYALTAVALAHVFLSLFTSAPGLVAMVRSGPAGNEAAFAWAMAITAVLYLNFAWFREQLCVIVCPYGRLQSVMTDRDSLIVGYDARRGEPRGRFVKSEVALRQGSGQSGAEKGDCTDCRRCVQVCPTGIDIRNGLQLECLACAQCIDACDEVMTKIGKPEGLIRYDSLKGLAGEKKRVLRPRLFAYGALLGAAVLGLVISLATRTPFEANLLRLGGTPYALEGGMVRNRYELHLVNKNPGDAIFEIRVPDAQAMQVVVAQREVPIASLESHRVPIFVSVPRESFEGPFPFQVEVVDRASGEKKQIEARFLGPKG